MSWYVLLGFIQYGTLCASWAWMTISFPILGKFSTIIFQIFSQTLSFFSSSSGTPIIRMLVCLVLSQRSLRLSSILFILFSLFCSLAIISTVLSSSSLIRSSASVILLFLLVYFSFQLLCCSSLFVCSLLLLDVC